MILKKVTFTGLDNYTDVDQLIEIWSKNQWIEWGILYSKRACGQASAFPSKEKILKLMFNNMHKSLHLCGESASDLLEHGKIDSEVLYLMSCVNRVQLNFNAKKINTNLNKFFSRIEDFHQSFILPVNEDNQNLIGIISNYTVDEFHYLFDHSSGRGVEMKIPSNPIPDKICGWCGGFNPSNLESMLLILESSLPKDLSIWIDLQSGVRTDDRFDSDKVKKCVDIINKFNETK